MRTSSAARYEATASPIRRARSNPSDAAPWFRIQNPWTQSKSYDPGGHYIRHWVPELKNAPLALLLAPPAGGLQRAAHDYPPPMLDHHAERFRTLAMFRQHRTAMNGGVTG